MKVSAASIAKFASAFALGTLLFVSAGKPLSAEGNGTGSGGAPPPPLPCVVAVYPNGMALYSDGTVMPLQ